MYVNGKPVSIYYDPDDNLIVPDVLRYDKDGDRILSDEESFMGFFDACVMDTPLNERRKLFKTQERYEKWCRRNGQPIIESESKSAD